MPKIFISPIQTNPDSSNLINSQVSANRIITGSVSRAHEGADFKVKTGTPISAIGDGKVIYSKLHENKKDSTKSYGNFIVVRHPAAGLDSDGKVYYSKYAHLSTRDVGVGDSVKAGQIIGKSGGAKGLKESGHSTGPHLHLEVKIEENPETGDKPFGGKPQNPNEYINYKQFSLKQQVEKLDGQYELEFRGNLGTDDISALGDQLFINDESLFGTALPLTNKNTNEVIPNIWKLKTSDDAEYVVSCLDNNNKISSTGTKLLINPLGATNTENCIIINNFPFSDSIKSAEEAVNNNAVSTTTAPFGIKLSNNNQIDFSKVEFKQLSKSVGDIGVVAEEDPVLSSEVYRNSKIVVDGNVINFYENDHKKLHPNKIMKTFKAITLLLSVLLITSLVNLSEVRSEEVRKEQNKTELQNQKITYSKAEEEVVLKKIDDLNKNPRLEYGKHLTKKEMLIRLDMMKKKKEYDMGWYERMISQTDTYKRIFDNSLYEEFGGRINQCNTFKVTTDECSSQKLLSKITQNQVISLLINYDDFYNKNDNDTPSSDLIDMLDGAIISVIAFGIGDYVDSSRKEKKGYMYYLKNELTGIEISNMIDNRIILTEMRKRSYHVRVTTIENLNKFFNQ